MSAAAASRLRNPTVASIGCAGTIAGCNIHDGSPEIMASSALA